MDTKFCPRCGQKVSQQTQQCPKCGYVFNSPAQPNQAPASQNKSNAFIYILVALIVLLVILFGVYMINNNNHSNSQNTSSSSAASNYSTNSTARSTERVNWNSDKAESFNDQFDDWADDMDQSYDSGPTTFDGVDYPEDFASRKFIINGDAATISMNSSSRNTAYKVVEIRHDDDDGYLYLFAFHDGTPIVLFTETGDANGNTVSLKTTNNHDLRNMFSDFQAN